VLGIVAYLHALLVAVLAIVVAVIILRRTSTASTDRGSSDRRRGAVGVRSALPGRRPRQRRVALFKDGDRI